MSIHPSAIISDGAQIHDSAEIGPGVVIGPNVKIGKGTKIGPHAIIDGYTEIGEDCNIFAGASIGLEPQDLSYKNEPTGVKIGNRCTIREYVTIHRATKEGFTTLGDDSFLMNYVHLAHNCKVGKHVIMANAASLAGYVEVGDYTVMSGFVIMHQFIRIGRFCMLSGMTGSRVDLPPFTTLDGRPAMVRGTNALGMKRGKISPEVRSAIKETYRIIYRSGLNVANALARVEEEVEPHAEIQEIIEFYRTTKRGVAGAFTEMEGEEDAGEGGSALGGNNAGGGGGVSRARREYSSMTESGAGSI